MKNLKQFEKICFQLLVLFSFNIFDIQPNFIAKDIASRLDTFIIRPFLKFLSIIKIYSINNYQLF